MKIRRRRTRNQERTMMTPRKATTSVSDTSMITMMMMKMTMTTMITMLMMMTIGDEDDCNEDDFENVTSIGASQASFILHFPSLRSRSHLS